MGAGTLTQAQADAVRGEFEVSAPKSRAGWLIEVVGYVGAGLILGAVALFLASEWESLGRGLQTAILVGMGVLLLAAALVIAGGLERMRALQGARKRAVGVLLALAPIPVAFGVGVAVERHEAAWAFGIGLAVSLGCLLLMGSGLGLAVAAGMSMGLVLSVAEEVFDASQLGSGLALVGLGAVWATVGRHVVSRVAGVGFALFGAQLPLGDSSGWAYALTLAVAVGCFVGYRWQRSLIMLAGGVIGVTLAVPEMIYDLTDGALGGAAILLIAGVVLVAASATGMSVHRRRAQPAHGE